MPPERLLVTVKTYPTLSTKYIETVCTAGVRPDGTWIRLYPVPFRMLAKDLKYKRYDWIECDVLPHGKDPRPESFRPVDPNAIVRVGHMGTDDNWHARRKLLLHTSRVFTSMGELIDGARSNTLSLAVFKPAKVIDLIVEAEPEREWDKEKLRNIEMRLAQRDLFEHDEWKETFHTVHKLPYKFSYVLEDAEGKRSTMCIFDLELGALFWKYCGDEEKAKRMVKKKYFDHFTRLDLHCFLGTTLRFHARAPNPWVIVGVLPIPCEHQRELPL